MRPALALTTLSCLLACAPPQPPAAPPATPAVPAVAPTPAPATPLFELELRRDSAPLIARLDDPDPGPVILALARVGDPPAIAALLTLLRGDDPRRREHAARALGIAAQLDPDLTDLEPALLAAWPRADADERRAIAEALGRLGGPAAVPVLRDALAPTMDPTLHRAAAIALGVLGRRKHPLDARARASLVALSDDPALTYSAIYALANEHSPPPDPPILGLLRRHIASDDRELQRLALAGLVRRSATPPLQACLTRELPAAASDPRRLAALVADDRQTAVLAALAWARSSIADPTSDEPLRLAHARQLHAALACLTSETTAPTARERRALEQLRTAIDRSPANATLTATTDNSPTPTNPPATSPADRSPTANPPATATSPTDSSPTGDLEHARRDAHRRLLARIDCQLAARLAHDPRWRPPLVCASPLLRPGELEAHELTPLIHGFGGPWPARAARLDALLTAPDPQLRLAAVSALGPLWHDPATTAIVHTWLLRALADPTLGVVGSAADVIAAPHDKPHTLTASDPLWQRLAALAVAHAAREPELHSGLLATLAATGVAAGLPVCEASRAHASPAVRKAARACVKQLGGADPGPSTTTASLPPPPLDPATVLGTPVRWILSTELGDLEIDLDPAAAPWAVAEIVALTRRGYYDGLRFHRDVPGFVLQGGDPEGNGWGGPGFVLPSEPGDHAFDRGAVGIADAGKDTGGSQFFFMHARAPHLEGRYTWIGRLRPDQQGHDRLDALAIGDQILRARVLIEVRI